MKYLYNIKDNERIEQLGKNVKIIVSDIHHFTTDTILLADFSSPLSKDKCVDLGSGCGTIPFLWARDNKGAVINAVEIQSDASELIEKSIKINGFCDKINVINSDLKDLKGKLEFGSFNVVSCNPPYKQIGSGVQSAHHSEIIARHEKECTISDITAVASKLLQFRGRFCLCLRPERLCDVIHAMRKADLEPKRLRFVHQRKNKEPKLFLIEGIRGGRPGLRVQPPLFIEDDNGNFSDEMKKIYGEYGENNR